MNKLKAYKPLPQVAVLAFAAFFFVSCGRNIDLAKDECVNYYTKVINNSGAQSSPNDSISACKQGIQISDDEGLRIFQTIAFRFHETYDSAYAKLKQAETAATNRCADEAIGRKVDECLEGIRIYEHYLLTLPDFEGSIPHMSR